MKPDVDPQASKPWEEPNIVKPKAGGMNCDTPFSKLVLDTF